MTQKSGVALLFCLLSYPAGAVHPQNGGVVWLDDYGEALLQARQTGKPILIEFRCEP